MFRSEDKLRRAVVFLSGRSSEDDDVLYSALKPVLRPPKRTLDASIVDFVWSDVGTVTLSSPLAAAAGPQARTSTPRGRRRLSSAITIVGRSCMAVHRAEATVPRRYFFAVSSPVALDEVSCGT